MKYLRIPQFIPIKPFLILLISLCFSTMGSAQISTWTGIVNSDWNNPANWNPAFVPNSIGFTSFIVTSGNDPAISSNISLKSLIILENAELTIEANNTLTLLEMNYPAASRRGSSLKNL